MLYGRVKPMANNLKLLIVNAANTFLETTETNNTDIVSIPKTHTSRTFTIFITVELRRTSLNGQKYVPAIHNLLQCGPIQEVLCLTLARVPKHETGKHANLWIYEYLICTSNVLHAIKLYQHFGSVFEPADAPFVILFDMYDIPQIIWYFSNQIYLWLTSVTAADLRWYVSITNVIYKCEQWFIHFETNG